MTTAPSKSGPKKGTSGFRSMLTRRRPVRSGIGYTMIMMSPNSVGIRSRRKSRQCSDQTNQTSSLPTCFSWKKEGESSAEAC